MIEVEIQNFQSAERVSLRIDGFTAIAGRSNIGKSSIVRAIQCALTGASGTDFVRHQPSCERRLKGNKKCKCQTTVRIKTSKYELTWEKGDSVNQYTLVQDGVKKVYTAVDRGTPDFLQPEFRPIKVGDSKGLVQVSEQWSPIFLLNQSGPAVADVLSDVARLDNINEAIRLVNKDRKDAAATRKVREQDVAQLRDAAAQYDGLDGAVGRVQQVEALHETAQELQEAVDKLAGFIGGFTRLDTDTKALEAATAPELPDVGGVSDSGAELERLTEFCDEILVRAPIVRQLKGIDDVALSDITSLTVAKDKFDTIDGWLAQVNELAGGYQALRGVVGDIPELDDGGLGKVETVEWLNTKAVRQATLTAEIANLTGQLATAEASEQEVLDGYADLGMCPTCSQEIDGSHRGHAK